MQKDRLAELDFLRFSAAAAVVLFHATHWPDAATWLTEVFKYGFMGVPLFFTISGFVILMTAQNRSGVAFVNSRIARLYPTFLIGLALSCAALAFLGDGLPSAATIAANLTMQPRMLFDQPYIDSVYWTLAVELKFYVLIFLLIIAGQMRRIELFLQIWLGVVVLETVLGAPHWMEALTFPMWASLFISGCYVYLIRSDGVTGRRMAAFIISGALSIVWALQYQSTYTKSTDFTVQLTVVSIVVLINAVFLTIGLRKWSLPSSPFLFWIGCLTYPLYLTHARAGQLVWKSLPGGEWLRVWLVLGLVLLLSLALAAFVERRACGALNRWLNRTTGLALQSLKSRFQRLGDAPLPAVPQSRRNRVDR